MTAQRRAHRGDCQGCDTREPQPVLRLLPVKTAAFLLTLLVAPVLTTPSRGADLVDRGTFRVYYKDTPMGSEMGLATTEETESVVLVVNH